MTNLFIFDKMIVMKKAEYKNSILSKKKIASTYLTLLIETGNKFTVTDIVNATGINRGTFYLHFKNLEDVAQYIENELASNFNEMEIDFRMSDIDHLPEVMIERLNEILSKDIEYYRLIITASDNGNLMEKIKNSILKSISNNFKIMKYVTNYEYFKMTVQYVVGGVVNVYTDWLKGHINCKLNDLKNFLPTLIRQGIKGIIKQNASEYY